MVAFSQLLAIVVLLLVVLFAAGPPSNVISNALQNTAKVFGLDIGTPNIASFTATPSKDGGVQFKLSIGGNKDNVVLEIYSAAASEDKKRQPPATVLKSPDVAIHDLAHLVYTSGTEKPEAVTNVECPKDGGKCCVVALQVSAACIKDKLAPDWYRFSACLKKKGTDTCIDSKDSILGLYTEDYVELLNLPIAGCKDSTFHDCNVIECKKELINTNLMERFASPLDLRRRSGVLRDISVKFRAEKAAEPGFDVASNCGLVGDAKGNIITDDKKLEATQLLLAGCRDKDIDDLNVKVARARMLEFAYEDTANEVNSEGKYKDHIGRISFWAEQAVKMTMSCTKGWLPAPKGAYSQLAKLGWVPRASTGGGQWEGKVNTELGKVLASLSPILTELEVTANSEKQLAVSWTLIAGSETIDSYDITLFRTDAAITTSWSGAMSLNAEGKIKLLSVPLPLGHPTITENFYTYPATGSLPSDQMGAYWFSLFALDGRDQQLKEVMIGVYNDQFVEGYRDFPSVDVDDACGSGCDVAGRKENALGSDNFGWSRPTGSPLTYTEIAFFNNKNNNAFQSSCHLEPKEKGQKRISGCLGSEVSLIYADVVKAYVSNNNLPAGKTAEDILKISCIDEKSWLDSELKYKSTRIREVCEAKSSLNSKLDKMGWAFVGS